MTACSKCGTEVDSDQRFCTTCGAAMPGLTGELAPMPTLSDATGAGALTNLAGFWWRALSFILDSIAVLILSELPANLLKVGFYPTVLISTVVIFLYWYLFVAFRGGQTLGMRIVSVRCVNMDGLGPVDARQSALRAGFYTALVLVGSLYHYHVYKHPTNAQTRRAGEEAFILFLLLVPHLVDLLWAAWDKKNQTLHDKVARTVVVRTTGP